MQVHNSVWLAEINKTKKTSFFNAKKTLVFPAIANECPAEIVQLIETIGTETYVEAGNPIETSQGNDIILVKQGIAGRVIYSDHGSIMTIALPRRLGSGDINFFTEQPTFEKCFAVVPTRIIRTSKKILEPFLKTEPELLVLFACNNEQVSLSQRLSFLSLAILPVEERIKMFFLSWSVNYARFIKSEDEGWLTMPFVIQRKYLNMVTKSSKSSLDYVLSEWKRNRLLITDKHRLSIRPSLLKSSFEWLNKDQVTPLSFNDLFY